MKRDTLEWMRRRRLQQQNIVPKISHFKCQLRIIFAARCHKPWHDKLYFLYIFFIWKLLMVCWRRRHCCCLFVGPSKCCSYTNERQKKKEKKLREKTTIKIDRHQLALRCAWANIVWRRECVCVWVFMRSLISFIKYHSTLKLHATHQLSEAEISMQRTRRTAIFHFDENGKSRQTNSTINNVTIQFSCR